MNFIVILSIIYLIIPAVIANTMPVFVKKYFKKLNYPIDFYKKINGKRILGDNKTFRGFIFGILGSIIIVLLQKILSNYILFSKISLIDYSRINILLFGFLIGFFVLLFDSIASFIKRRLNFKPGESFFILDQINGGIGFVFTIYFYLNSFNIILFSLIIWFLGHFLIKYLGYLFEIDKNKI